jgi:hypothetical protein
MASDAPQRAGRSPHESLGAYWGLVKSGPWWTLTYQPDTGIAYPTGTVLAVVALPEASATTGCSAYAMPPGAAHSPACTCETWLDPGGKPFRFKVTVNEPALLTIWPVPATELPF